MFVNWNGLKNVLQAKSMLPFANLMRLANLPTIWSNIIVGLGVGFGFSKEHDFSWFIFIGLSLLYVGGIVLNDVFDNRYDCKAKSDKPICLGDVSIKVATLIGHFSLVTGLIFISLPTWINGRIISYEIILSVAIIVSIYIYNKFHKKYLWSLFFMGIARFLVYIVSALSVSGIVQNELFFLSILVFLYISLITIYGQTNNVLIGKFVLFGFLSLFLLFVIVNINLQIFIISAFFISGIFISFSMNSRINMRLLIAMICVMDSLFLLSLQQGRLAIISLIMFFVVLFLQQKIRSD